MPVNSTHPDYDEYLKQWKKCRVVVEGEDAVKDAGTDYLPKLTDQENPEYDAYKARASFYNATRRTVIGLAGAVMRKPAENKVPKKVEDLLKTLGVKNTPLDILQKKSVEEELTIGRLGLFVDAPTGTNTNPFVALYYAENIINWQKEVILGKEQPTLVVLKEKKEVRDSGDIFKVVCEDRWRVLRLIGAQSAPDLEGNTTISYTYTVEIWREKTEDEMKTAKNKDDKFIKEETIVPTKWGGKPLDYIPFLFVTPAGVTDEVENSPSLDMANVNLSLYRNSADYEHGLHFTALPTVWTAGFDVKTTKLRVGANNAWSTENEQATCGMLEFTGQGLGAIRETMEAKKKELATLGGRLLEEQKREAEAAATVAIRQSGESSVLTNVANSLSEAWSQVLKWVGDWMSQETTEISTQLNSDFTVTNIDAPTLAQISADVQSGLLSWSTYFYNLKRAEMVPDNVTEEDERTRIESGVPMAPPTPKQQAEHDLEVERMKTQSALDKQQQQQKPQKTTPAAA
jgi:hypothetical protein